MAIVADFGASVLLGILVFQIVKMFRPVSPDREAAGPVPQVVTQEHGTSTVEEGDVLGAIHRLVLLRYGKLEDRWQRTNPVDPSFQETFARGEENHSKTQQLAKIFQDLADILKNSTSPEDREAASKWASNAAVLRARFAGPNAHRAADLRSIAPPPGIAGETVSGNPAAVLNYLEDLVACVRSAEAAVNSLQDTPDRDASDAGLESLGGIAADYLTARCASDASSPMTERLRKVLDELLELFGWSLIDVKEGVSFDNRFYERLDTVPSDSNHVHNTVAEIHSLGYCDGTGRAAKKAEVSLAIEVAP